MRVLIIDDDPNIIALASFALRGRGIEVIASTVPSEGLRIAQSENVDAILLDLVMPELDGRALFAQLRENESTRELPVVFMTAKNSQSEMAALHELDARGVIAKPFDPADWPARSSLTLALRSRRLGQ